VLHTFVDARPLSGRCCGREHGIWGRPEARSSRSERALDGEGDLRLLTVGFCFWPEAGKQEV
jgi:hypothetical protein